MLSCLVALGCALPVEQVPVRAIVIPKAVALIDEDGNVDLETAESAQFGGFDIGGSFEIDGSFGLGGGGFGNGGYGGGHHHHHHHNGGYGGGYGDYGGGYGGGYDNYY